jgi:CRISPR-associated protein Cmr1
VEDTTFLQNKIKNCSPDMHTLSAHFRVVTPLFLGGANPTVEAELRPASIKGALRFWWRALMWSRGVSDVATLRGKEAALFGSSEKGQAKFLLTTSPSAELPQISAKSILGKTGTGAVPQNSREIVDDGARYLGYGLMHAFPSKNTDTLAGQLSRPCLPSPFEFEVKLAFKNSATECEISSIADALKLLGLCGGLGSRSRRGWGSLTLAQLSGTETWGSPKNAAAFEQTLNVLFPHQAPQNTAAPLWSAFASAHSKVLLLEDEAKYTPLETLSEIGADLVFFRSWGHHGTVLYKPSERNFKHDHDLMKQHPNQRRTHPQRIAFGLPQNYEKGDSVKPAERDFDRRASPLFFHIHQAAPGDAPLGVLTFLPSLFLPPNHDKISVGGASISLGNNGGVAFWKPVTDFLTRLQNGTGKVQFLNTRLWHF